MVQAEMKYVNTKSQIHKALDHCRFIADNYSKDRSGHIAALILGADWEPLSWGYNGFPRGIDDEKEERHERPAKYLWTEHAERNAIFNAARSGHKLLGSNMFITGLAPCSNCARAIIQSGIAKIYIPASSVDFESENKRRWLEEWKVAEEMLLEAKVEIILVDEDPVPIHKPDVNLV